MEKRYYWLKLHDDFFTSKRIKKLRRLAGGDTFTIIYLKMQLKSLKTDGILEYTGIENSFAEELALDIDEDTDNVQITINYLMNVGLLEANDNEYKLPYLDVITGSETASTQRSRDCRARKMLQCNNNATQLQQDATQVQQPCNVEKEKEIEKDKDKDIKHKHGTYKKVLLTDEQYQKLKEDYPNAEELIEFLDAYIQEKGYKAKEHYLSIKRWVVDAVTKKPKYDGTEMNVQDTNIDELRKELFK